MTISELSNYMAMAYFDFRTIHFNTSGDSFYTYHGLAEFLYEKCEDYYDDLVETAIGNDEWVCSLGTSIIFAEDWELIDPTDFNKISVKETKEYIYDTLVAIWDKINEVYENEEYDSFVYSKLDSMKEFFDKEIYKIKQSLKEEKI